MLDRKNAPRKYAESSRQPGELSVSEAARRLGMHPDTVRLHARGACVGPPARPDDSRARLKIRFTEVRRDLIGRYWISERELERQKATDPDAAACW